MTGLTLRAWKLHYKGEPVEAIPLRNALIQFLQWLKQFNAPLLIAHNCKRFDSKHLLRGMKKVGLYAEFTQVCAAFADTLPLARALLPRRKGGYSQQALLRDVLNITYEAHDAVSDVEALQQLTRHLLRNKDSLSQHKFQIQDIE